MKKRYVAALGILIVLAVSAILYVGDYYHAEEVAITTIEQPAEDVNVHVYERGIAFEASEPVAGMIFYPGGKVAPESYAPLMEACAKAGITCVLVEMPANLAVLDVKAAEGIQKKFPEITTWYMAGHSLGGSMAASYLGSCAEEYEGLILFASYSTEDLSETDYKVLSIYGSEDGVLNREKYQEYASNMPEDYLEVTILGGNHAYFGAYGEQEGDGEAKISREDQIILTVEAIKQFVGIE